MFKNLKIISAAVLVLAVSLVGIFYLLFFENNLNNNSNISNSADISPFGRRVSAFMKKVIAEPEITINVLDTETGNPGSTKKVNQENFFTISLEEKHFQENGKLNSSLLKKVLAHELMHVLSLQNNQVFSHNPANFDPLNIESFIKMENECGASYFTVEGCLKENSYLTMFKNKFWNGEMKDEYEQIQLSDNSNFNTLMEEWCNKHKDKFISQNSCQSPEEDMAEIFSFWLINSEQQELTPTQTEKLTFLKNYTELNIIKEKFNLEFQKEFQ